MHVGSFLKYQTMQESCNAYTSENYARCKKLEAHLLPWQLIAVRISTSTQQYSGCLKVSVQSCLYECHSPLQHIHAHTHTHTNKVITSYCLSHCSLSHSSASQLLPAPMLWLCPQYLKPPHIFTMLNQGSHHFMFTTPSSLRERPHALQIMQC